MPFNTLLLTCLQSTQTVLADSKTKVLLKGIKTDETVLVFESDNQSNPRCKLRKFLWDNQQGQGLCDFIVFYANDEQRVICFVELKDNIGDLKKAVNQVVNTYDAFRQHLTLPYTPKAFIVGQSGSVPQEHNESQGELLAKFGKNNYHHDGGHSDFLEFLRGTLNPKKDKFKKGRAGK